MKKCSVILFLFISIFSFTQNCSDITNVDAVKFVFTSHDNERVSLYLSKNDNELFLGLIPSYPTGNIFKKQTIIFELVDGKIIVIDANVDNRSEPTISIILDKVIYESQLLSLTSIIPKNMYLIGTYKNFKYPFGGNSGEYFKTYLNCLLN